jgi:hypothetical protein
MEKRKSEVWLLFYGIFVALLIQSFYDAAGSYFGGTWNLGSLVQLTIGLGASALGFPLLIIWLLRRKNAKPE